MQKDLPPDVFHSVDGVTRCWRFRSHRTVKRKMPLNSVEQGRRERVRVPVKNVFRSPSKVGQAKNIYNKSARISVAECFELDLKGLILTIDK